MPAYVSISYGGKWSFRLHHLQKMGPIAEWVSISYGGKWSFRHLSGIGLAFLGNVSISYGGKWSFRLDSSQVLAFMATSFNLLRR